MEFEVAMFGKRVFMLLDDGWYILNDSEATAYVSLNPKDVSIYKKDGKNFRLIEAKSDDDRRIISYNVFNNDGRVVIDDVWITYEMMKQASRNILDKDPKGLHIQQMMDSGLMSKHIVNIKGDKTND